MEQSDITQQFISTRDYMVAGNCLVNHERWRFWRSLPKTRLLPVTIFRVQGRSSKRGRSRSG